jgi:hypothetical protein
MSAHLVEARMLPEFFDEPRRGSAKIGQKQQPENDKGG